MSFTTPPQHGPAGLGFTNDTTKLRAEWLNYVGGNFSKALDAIGGGYYQFTSDIRLSCDTAQVKINAPAAADPIALLGYVTIGVSDDANYAVGVGTLTVASAATFSAATTFSSTVQFNGAQTFNAAVTFTTNGDITLQSGCAVTGQSGSSLTMENGTTTAVDVLNVNDTLTMATDKNIVLTGTGKITFAAPRSYRRPCRLVYIDPTYWGPETILPTAWPHRVQQLVATNPSNPNENLRYECDIPPGASAVNVQVYVTPAAGHGGSMPANRPQLIVYIYDSDAETSPVTGSPAVANAALAVDYEQRTLLTVTAGVNTLITPQKVICQVYGEGGANFIAGLIVDEPTFSFSTPDMKEP